MKKSLVISAFVAMLCTPAQAAEDWQVEINAYGCSSPFGTIYDAYRKAREKITARSHRHRAICENAGGLFTLSFQNGLCNPGDGMLCSHECLVWGDGYCDAEFELYTLEPGIYRDEGEDLCAQEISYTAEDQMAVTFLDCGDAPTGLLLTCENNRCRGESSTGTTHTVTLLSNTSYRWQIPGLQGVFQQQP